MTESIRYANTAISKAHMSIQKVQALKENQNKVISKASEIVNVHLKLTLQVANFNCLMGSVPFDEVQLKRCSNREENSIGDEASCSLPKVYLYTLWSTCVHKPLRGD